MLEQRTCMLDFRKYCPGDCELTSPGGKSSGPEEWVVEQEKASEWFRDLYSDEPGSEVDNVVIDYIEAWRNFSLPVEECRLYQQGGLPIVP